MSKLSTKDREDIQRALDHLADAVGSLVKASALIDGIELKDPNDSYDWRHQVSCPVSHAHNAMNGAGNYLTQVHQRDVSWEAWQDRIKRRNGGADV